VWNKQEAEQPYHILSRQGLHLPASTREYGSFPFWNAQVAVHKNGTASNKHGMSILGQGAGFEWPKERPKHCFGRRHNQNIACLSASGSGAGASRKALAWTHREQTAAWHCTAGETEEWPPLSDSPQVCSDVNARLRSPGQKAIAANGIVLTP